MTLKINTDQNPVYVPTASAAEEGLLSAAGSEVLNKSVSNSGIIPSAIISFNSEPVANDTITIDGQVFKYVAALGAATTFMQIKTALGAVASLQATVDAVNGTPNANVVQATTAFTQPILASVFGTALEIELSSARGFSPAIVGAAPNIPLLSTMTDVMTFWDVANLNQSAGNAAQILQSAVGNITITSNMATFGTCYLFFPFNATKVLFNATDFLQNPKYITDFVIVFGNQGFISIGAGATPLIAGDIVTFQVFE
jgi:hypothetical protein